MIEIRQNETNLINYEYNKELIENLLLIKEAFVDDILPELKSKNDFEIDFDFTCMLLLVNFERQLSKKTYTIHCFRFISNNYFIFYLVGQGGFEHSIL